ncbi:MAG: hypothetical protein AAF703_19445 [Cyanobacteria bacterium P01_D01_bin.105]
MKSSKPAESARSAPTQYAAASVPMTVYRELAAELRANKAVIDSLNSRNQQLLQQNQMLKHEIHNALQATLKLGNAAGVALPAEGMKPGFPSAIAPDTLAKLVRDERQHPEQYDYYEQPEPAFQPPLPVTIRDERRPRPIEHSPAEQAAAARLVEPRGKEPRGKKTGEKRFVPTTQKAIKKVGASPKNRGIDQNLEKIAKRQKAARQAISRGETPSNGVPKAPQESVLKASQIAKKPLQKLFTEQAGGYRNASESEEIKEISGIWLVLSIALIVVTAFGAGFLIMKPLLGDR